MVSEINAVIQSVRILNDLVQAHRTLRNFNQLATAVYEVNAKLFAAISVALVAQEQQATLAHRVAELEKEVERAKDWERERKRYRLAEAAPGLFVYRVQTGMEDGEPVHDLCAHCFANAEKAILQRQQAFGGWAYQCLRCHNLLTST